MSDTPPHKEKASHLEDGDSLHLRDKAAEIVLQHQNEAEPTDEEKSRVLWKIDVFMMPMMVFVYGLQYLDKLGYSLSTSFGAIKDLGLSEIKNGKSDISRYKTGATLFWVGYLVGLYPLSLMAQKMPVAKATTIIVVVWGAVYLCGAACHNYQGIFVQRFFLGVFEAGVTPCFMLLTANFYTKREQASRTAIWYSACGLAAVIGLTVLYGVLQIPGPDSAHPWRRFYYLWGVVTIVFGGLFYVFVPSSPTTARFLSEREKYVAIHRLRENQAEIDTHKWDWSQVKEAFLDPKVLLLFPISFFCYFANACVSTFSPIILSGFGYTPLETLLYLTPSGALNMGVMIGLGFLQQYVKGTRFLSFVIVEVIILVCSALLWKLPQTDKSGKYACVVIFGIFSSGYVTFVALAIANVAGRTKRTVANSILMTGYTLSNIVSPLTFPSTAAPVFADGFKVTMATLVIAIAFGGVYVMLCMKENKRRDALGEQPDHAFEDMTDKANLRFRYVW
ncbi:MFS general substrate transporter [Meredithblackwellia eburnea MCA 4105]